MSSSRQFQLHVQIKLHSPVISDDGTITYGPLSVINLEASKTITVQIGAHIAQCNSRGKVYVSPTDKYSTQLSFKANAFGPNDRNSIEIKITNKSKEFVRIEQEDHLFKYGFTLNDQPKPVVAEEKPVVAEEMPVVAEEMPVIE